MGDVNCVGVGEGVGVGGAGVGVIGPHKSVGLQLDPTFIFTDVQFPVIIVPGTIQ